MKHSTRSNEKKSFFAVNIQNIIEIMKKNLNQDNAIKCENLETFTELITIVFNKIWIKINSNRNEKLNIILQQGPSWNETFS